eukprot:XP_016658979.1 PREDICTED: uncharacterized protein LOC107883451 [Acyrthosiphon pisum]
MSNKKLTDIEIENELNEFYANSESEEEFDFDETDEAVLDFGIESQEPVFQDFEINEAVKTVTGKYISLADFQLNLINELILKYQIKGVKETNRRKKPMDTLEKRLQLDARHFPELVPLTPTKKKKEGDFVMFAVTRRKTKKEKIPCTAVWNVM